MARHGWVSGYLHALWTQARENVQLTKFRLFNDRNPPFGEERRSRMGGPDGRVRIESGWDTFIIVLDVDIMAKVVMVGMLQEALVQGLHVAVRYEIPEDDGPTYVTDVRILRRPGEFDKNGVAA